MDDKGDSAVVFICVNSDDRSKEFAERNAV